MKIEDLYSTSLNSSPTYDENNIEWIKIDTELRRKEFYIFSLYRFNVYYASLLLLNLMTTAWMIHSQVNHDNTTNHTHSFIQQPKENKLPSLVSTTRKTDTLKSIKANIDPTPQNHSTYKSDNKINHEVKEKVSSQTVDTVLAIHDSNSNNTPTILKESPIPPPIKDTVIIHRKDTIIQVDSIKISNRKWKKINNKKI